MPAGKFRIAALERCECCIHHQSYIGPAPATERTLVANYEADVSVHFNRELLIPIADDKPVQSFLGGGPLK